MVNMSDLKVECLFKNVVVSEQFVIRNEQKKKVYPIFTKVNEDSATAIIGKNMFTYTFDDDQLVVRTVRGSDEY